MTDLPTFLLARIAEDEAAARAAGGAPWQVIGGNVHLTGESANAAVAVGPYGGDIGRAAIHIVRHQPANVLAECEAKRRLLDLHELVTEDYAGEWWTDPSPPGTYVVTGCDHCRSAGVDGREYVGNGPCDTLRCLALPYADHPDYREEWKP